MCKFNSSGTRWWNCSLRVCIIIALFLCLNQIVVVNAASSTTCTSSSNCTLREWLVKLQEENSSLECSLAQLEKSTALLSKVNYSTTSTRLIQIEKLKKAISNLKGEIEIISLTCSTFYGPDCNQTTPECNSKSLICASPNVCSNCTGNWDGPTCSVCKTGWNGTDCNIPICDSKCSNCSSPGVCNNCTGNWNGTTCSNCKSGWNGTLCNIPICDSKCINCSSPGNCSNCTGNWNGPTCSVCKSEWNGTLCNIPVCDSKCINCSSPGVCNNCTGNWNGTTCSTCKSGWYGSDCNTPPLILSSAQITKFTNLILSNAQINYSKLLFKATRDGFTTSAFHSKSNNKGPTIVIVKATTGAIFGGYTSVSWSSGGYAYDSSSFIFSLVSSTKEERFTKLTFQNSYLFKTNLNANIDNPGIFDHTSFGPTFGRGFDFTICDNSNTLSLSYSQLCYAYCDSTMAYNTDTAKTYLAGSFQFQVEDYEVFSM